MARRVDPAGRLVRTWPLAGATSAELTALEIEVAGGPARRLVVREYGSGDLAADRTVAANEFRLLDVLASRGLPVPAPRHLDESRDILPAPYIVIDFVDGEREAAPTDLSGFIGQLAAILARIHDVDPANADLSFLPRLQERVGDRLRRRPALDEHGVWATLESAWPLPERNNPVLLHGDFWPGNTLWRDGELVAVVDWEDAALGDPVADLANARLEVLWAFGVDATDEFTRRSRRDLDLTDLPYWDLYADLRLAPRIREWGLDVATEQRMLRQHGWFVAQALEATQSGSSGTVRP